MKLRERVVSKGPRRILGSSLLEISKSLIFPLFSEDLLYQHPQKLLKLKRNRNLSYHINSERGGGGRVPSHEIYRREPLLQNSLGTARSLVY